MTLTSSADPALVAPATQGSRTAQTRTVADRPNRLLRAGRRAAGRLLAAAGVLVGAATAAFVAQNLLPGDRATTILNIRQGQAVQRTAEELSGVRAQYGLDRPILVQYLDYVGGLLRGDLGLSYQQFRPVRDIILEQLAPTLALTVAAVALAWLLLVVWVTLTAGRPRAVRAVGSFADTLAAGLPHYWLGIILLVVFAVRLGWFPVIGGTGPAGLVLPAVTLALPLAGFMAQATRTEYERALDQPFVLSARMRGMADLGIRLRHVLRHAVLPAITLSGWALGATVSGAVVVEQVFSRPGIGSVLVTAVNSQDLPVVTGVVVLVAALYVLVNLLVDGVYTLVDPRLRAAS